MAQRFSTELRKLLGSMDQNTKLTPSEILTAVKNIRNGNSNGNSKKGDVSILSVAFGDKRFIKKIAKAYGRSASGKVVLYIKKSEPNLMTYERMSILQRTVKVASEGLRKYYDKRAKK